jgi:hypothetical protein
MVYVCVCVYDMFLVKRERREERLAIAFCDVCVCVDGWVC